MDFRVALFLWSLAIMAITAPIAWMWGYEPKNMGETLAVLQTLASIVAVVLALGVAGFEHFRAALAERRRRSRTKDVARDVLRRLLETLAVVASHEQTDEWMGQQPGSAEVSFDLLVKHLIRNLRVSEQVMEALIPVAADADLALWLAETKTELEIAWSPLNLGAEVRCTLAGRERTQQLAAGCHRRFTAALKSL